MSRRFLTLLFLGASLALPEAARAQLTGTVSAILTGMTVAAGATYSGSGTSTVTTSQGENVSASAPSFGTWNNSTSSTYNTSVVFNNVSQGKKALSEIAFGGTFELKLTLTAPVATTISLGVWNWVFDNGTYSTAVAGKDALDFVLVGKNSSSYSTTYGSGTVTWGDNKTGGSFSVSTRSGNTLTTSTYSYTLYGGYVTGTGTTVTAGTLVNDVELKEGKTVTVNSGFQITGVSTVVTTVPEPGTYALGAGAVLASAAGWRELKRKKRKQASA